MLVWCVGICGCFDPKTFSNQPNKVFNVMIIIVSLFQCGK